MKTYKKVVLFGIILTSSIVFLGLKHQNKDKLQLMMDILNRVDGSFIEGDISLGGAILDEFIEMDTMEQIGESIKDKLGIKGILLKGQFSDLDQLKDHYHKEYIMQEGFNQLIIRGMDDKDNFITISLSSYIGEEERTGETCLYINLINDKHFIENNDIIKRVEKIFDKYDKAINVTSCIVGSINGNIDLDVSKAKVLEATDTIDGKVVEKYEEDGIVSYSIYSPFIEEYIYTGPKKMNLNIALRYSELEDKTYILIGTPIITIGY